MRRALAAALLAAAGGAAAAPFEVDRFAAEGGRPEIALAPRPGRRATLVVAFGAGAVDDGSRSGLVRLAQHALLSANRRLDFPRLALDVHGGAGELRIETGLRECAFVYTADRRDFDRVAPQLLEALLAPRLDPERFAIARRRAAHDGQEPGGGQDLVTVVASLAVDDLRYENEPHGDPEQLEFLEVADVEGLLADLLSPANATVVAAGSFDREALLRAARRRAAGRRTPPAPPPLRLPVRSSRRTARELHVVAYPIRPETPRAAAAAHVLGALVEEELWRAFRDAGVGYAFLSATARSPWLDLFVVGLPAQGGSSVNLRAPLERVLERVASGAFPAERYALARAVASTGLRRLDADPEALARALAGSRPPWFGRATADALAALDAEAFRAEVSGWLAAANGIRLDTGPEERP